MNETKTEYATFGGGCFWCVEAIYELADGVLATESGYTGGAVQNPSYGQICTGQTGHAEVVRVTYDPQKTSYQKLLDIFFDTHNPTTLNRQGNDVGTQYRSAVFYHSPKQKAAADQTISKLDASGEFENPIVTKVEPAAEFYKAERYHQDYFAQNPNASYCRFVVKPKVDKFKNQQKAEAE